MQIIYSFMVIKFMDLKSNEIRHTNNCYLCTDEDDWEKEFKVFPLSHFFYELKKKCVESSVTDVLPFPNDVLAESELRKDTYHFSSEMACTVR